MRVYTHIQVDILETDHLYGTLVFYPVSSHYNCYQE